MRVLIWTWRYVPGWAFLWFRVLFRLFSFVVSTIEAMWWWRAGRPGRVELRSMSEMHSVRQLVAWYERVGFAWTSDPWGGILDYWSRPWVTVVKRRGDCDDMATLAYHIFRGKFPVVRRYITYSRTGEGHVVLMIMDDVANWVCVSNTKAYPVIDLEAGVRSTYGDDTVFWYAC